MAYQTLYRRYRPRRFMDVRGQEPIVRALRNAVRDDRVGHAYLFSGPRGTGKTSTARILAKALNCEHLDNGEPDGTCDSCLSIDAGTSYDVQELDAASNNKVDDIEDLIGRVNLGSPGRTKVYILDEVHMLTTAAANKLLKTLEEPPDHVVFVLATTDPQKVLPTIKSRTQHFEFHLLSAEELAEHVAWVIHDAELGLPADVIEHVVRLGQGSARDTLSALDQVAAAGGVLDKGEALDDLLDAIAAADAGRALVAVADAVASGRDPRVLGEAVLARLRDVFLLRMGASTDHLPSGDVARVQAWADQLGDRATTRALEAIGDALMEMRQAPEPRIPLEVAVVKLTRADADPSIDAILTRLAALEAAVANGVPTAAPRAVPAASPAAAAAPSAPAPTATEPAAPPTPTPAAPPAPSRPVAAVPPVAAPPASAPTAAPAPSAGSGGESSGGSGPAALARAALAAQRAERARGGGARPGRPAAAAPAASPAPTPSSAPPAEAPAAAAPVPPTAVAPAAPATAAPATDAPAAPASTPGAVPGREQLTELWNEKILPSLGGLAKAMYAAGRFTETEGSVLVFGLPNEVHRQKCEQKRAEVEQALIAQLGTPITLRLAVDGDAEAFDAGNGGGVGAAPRDLPGPDDDVEVLGGTDVHDLEDAPDAKAGGLAALTEAFPGAELIDET